MDLHRLGGLFRIPGLERRKDLADLLLAVPGTVGFSAVDVLDSLDLVVVAGDDFRNQGIAAGVINHLVELVVHLGKLHGVIRGGGVLQLQPVKPPLELGQLAVGYRLGGDVDGVPLQKQAYLADMERLLDGDLAYNGAGLRFDAHQAVLLQPSQGVAHRGAADAVLFRQQNLGELLSGEILQGQDFFQKLLVYRIPNGVRFFQCHLDCSFSFV